MYTTKHTHNRKITQHNGNVSFLHAKLIMPPNLKANCCVARGEQHDYMYLQIEGLDRHHFSTCVQDTHKTHTPGPIHKPLTSTKPLLNSNLPRSTHLQQ